MLSGHETVARGRGFTLIEMLITVAVLAVLAVLALPSFRQWIVNTKIRSTTESVLAGFQLARTEAVQRNRGVQLVLGADSGWTVTEAATGAAIQARPATEGSGGTRLTVTPAGASTVVFNGLGRVANANPITRVEVDSTALPAASIRALRITINAGGEARACDPSKPASDPRRC